MTNYVDILIDKENNEKVAKFIYSDKPQSSKTPQKKKSMPGSEHRGAVLEKNKTKQNTHTKKTKKKPRKYFKKDNFPYHSKTSKGPMCLTSNDLWLPNMAS